MPVSADIDEDKADLGVLDETLRKTSELTNKISSILTQLNHRLEKVENTIKPIYKTTLLLKKESENIRGTIIAVERTRQYFNIVPEAEDVIKKGPEGDLTLFLDTLKKTNNSLNILRSSNFRSSEKSILRLTQLWKGGCLQLYELFKNSLLDFSIPVEPLYYTTKNLDFPLLPELPCSILMSISSFFYSTCLDSLKEIEKNYCDTRSGYTSESLKLLSKASLSTAVKREMKMYEKNSNGFVVYTQALLGMLKAESTIAQNIFPENYGNILLTLIYSTIVTYCDTIQKLDHHIHQNMVTDFTLSYEIIEELSKIITVIDLHGSEGPTVNELHKSMEIMGKTGTFALSDMHERIRKRCSAMTSISSDGNVSEIITESVTRLVHMNNYPETVSYLIMTMKNEGWNSFLFATNQNAFPPGTDEKVVFKKFCSETIEILYSQLEQKARTLTKKTNLLPIFLLNNLAYIEKNIKNTALSIAVTSDVTDRFVKIKKRIVNEFLDSWKGCAEQLLDVTYVKGGITSSTKLSLAPKERDIIKEKFKSFNNEFDELLSLCKTFVIYDSELKSSLVGEVKRIIVPLYTRFYNKYYNSEFSKHQGKYIKYEKNDIDMNLTYLFD
ncbi:GTP-Rho binding exocyst subunit EXO70 [Pneumocystis jirovecii RU7]|uniref:Exocyst complex protein EXO70 n=1 Tax=Pneumocystis jirovecii (strain RU7) TaxID=1408657 RepID=A0A0W4ZHI4_PNEJ7|nr:GTP-Rho binding exocyst subunit EXO70 [Pneumocystis jirovecii RU7]KTW27825.1 hypothetical protein T551_02792 [Pneumocystis jirovecii RU7]